MISERNGNVKVQDNLHGERIAMDIAAGAKAHIMAILTNLYSNRKGAVVREYSTNAYDSHVMAGCPERPIEVTLPDFNAPLGSRSLVIRDYGIGLSVDDIHAIYSQYGESTKNDSNDYNGMLGLGSKSGLTYTNSFSVVGVKNGVRTSVAVGLDDDGLPQMTVLETVASGDHPGVTVTIPVKGGDDFRQVAESFYRFWHRGTVLVNGGEPADFRDSALHVCAEDGITIWVDEHAYHDRNYIVMGNVAYPATIEHKMAKGGLIVEVPIGAVNFTPSREALMDTKRTRDTLAKIESLFFKHIQAAAQTDIDAAATPTDAIDRMYRWEQTMARGAAGGDYFYRGRRIPRNYTHADVMVTKDGVFEREPGIVKVPYHKRKLNHHQRVRSVSSEEFKHAVWFTGFDLAAFNSNHRKKIDHWFDQQPQALRESVAHGGSYYRNASYYLVKDTPPVEWIDPSRIVPWATIAAIRLNPAGTGRNGGPTRLTGSYDMYEDGAHKSQILASDIKTTKPLFYVRGNRYEAQCFIDALNHFHPKGYTLVHMGENRIAKFKRDFPTAQWVAPAVQDMAKQWMLRMSDEVKVGLAMSEDSWTIREYEALDPARIDDPDLKRAAYVANNLDLTGPKAIRKILWRTLGRAALNDHLKGWTNPLEKYPLYSESVVRDYPDHVYHYLNTAFSASTTI